MTLFIRRIFRFILLIGLLIVFLDLLFYLVYQTPTTSRNKIFLGDSTSKASIDTKIAREYENYSQGGETYLFSYIKLKRLIETQKVDTVLINFSPLNIINNKFDLASMSGRQRYFPIIDQEGHWDLFKSNPIVYLRSFAELPKDLFSLLKERKINFGGFTANVSKKYNENFYSPNHQETRISPYQEKYLSKIVKLSRENNIHLVFINLPKFTGDKNYKNYNHPLFLHFYKKNYADIDFINLSDFRLENYTKSNEPEKNYFADMIHHNEKGGVLFSKIFSKMTLSSLLKSTKYNEKLKK